MLARFTEYVVRCTSAQLETVASVGYGNMRMEDYEKFQITSSSRRMPKAWRSKLQVPSYKIQTNHKLQATIGWGMRLGIVMETARIMHSDLEVETPARGLRVQVHVAVVRQSVATDER